MEIEERMVGQQVEQATAALSRIKYYQVRGLYSTALLQRRQDTLSALYAKYPRIPTRGNEDFGLFIVDLHKARQIFFDGLVAEGVISRMVPRREDLEGESLQDESGKTLLS